MDYLENSLNRSFTGASTVANTSSGPPCTVKSILEAVKSLRPLWVPIWRGERPEWLSVPETPVLHSDPSAKDGFFYVVAGIGIVGHPSIMDGMKERVRLYWVADPPEYNYEEILT